MLKETDSQINYKDSDCQVIAKATGYSYVMVSATLSGDRNNKKITEAAKVLPKKKKQAFTIIQLKYKRNQK